MTNDGAVRRIPGANTLLPLAAVGILAALFLVLPIRYVFLTTEILIAVLYATSLNLLMGYGGMLSLGHSAYYALGAYTTGLLAVQLSWPMLPAMLAGPLVAALFAFVFGIFIVRTSHQEHAYFLMLTLAFSQLVYAMIYKWYGLTHGDDGISGILPTGIIGTPRSYAVFTLAVVAVCLGLLRRIVNSPFGLTLQAIRDNPRRAEFVGLSVRRYQLAAFVIAGLFGGVAGTLYAYFSGTISPQLAEWGASARPFLANTIGGIQSFWGPLVGVLVLEVIDSQVGRVTEHSLLAVGALALLVPLFFPQGIIGLLRHRTLAWPDWAVARRLWQRADRQ
jgi:branched-chain amino acid transport system permease protein